jgi:hypothetical protein
MPGLESFAESLLERSPSEYLRERLRILAVSWANGPEIDRLSEHGVKLGDLDLRWTSVDDVHPASEMSAAARFASMDSAVLLHQTAETLWHWFLAAVAEEPAPWFSIPATSPQKLQHQIETFRSGPRAGSDDSVGIAFVDAWEPGPPERQPRDKETAAAVAELRQLMLWFAEHVGSAGAYNGIKHGSAAIPKRQRLSLEIDGRTIDWASGESLIVLRRDGQPNNGREPWILEQRWYSLAVCLAGTAMGCSLLDLVWERIRHRARGRGVRAIKPDEVSGLTVDVLRKLDDHHYSEATHRFTWTPNAVRR